MKSTVECVFPPRGGVLRKTDTRYYGCKIKSKQKHGRGGGGHFQEKHDGSEEKKSFLAFQMGFSLEKGLFGKIFISEVFYHL